LLYVIHALNGSNDLGRKGAVMKELEDVPRPCFRMLTRATHIRIMLHAVEKVEGWF
jgi:hypothetical protein